MKPKDTRFDEVSFVSWPPMPKPTPLPPKPPPMPPETPEADRVIETNPLEVEVDLPPNTELW